MIMIVECIISSSIRHKQSGRDKKNGRESLNLKRINERHRVSRSLSLTTDSGTDTTYSSTNCASTRRRTAVLLRGWSPPSLNELIRTIAVYYGPRRCCFCPLTASSVTDDVVADVAVADVDVDVAEAYDDNNKLFCILTRAAL